MFRGGRSVYRQKCHLCTTFFNWDCSLNALIEMEDITRHLWPVTINNQYYTPQSWYLLLPSYDHHHLFRLQTIYLSRIVQIKSLIFKILFLLFMILTQYVYICCMYVCMHVFPQRCIPFVFLSTLINSLSMRVSSFSLKHKLIRHHCYRKEHHHIRL